MMIPEDLPNATVMIPEATTKVSAALSGLGRLTLGSVASYLERSPLKDVLKKENVLFQRGPIPCEGERWHHLTVGYAVADEEVRRWPASDLAEAVSVRRAAALLDFLKQLEGAFGYLSLGLAGTDPSWRIILLEGEWLRETATRPAGQLLTQVFIDGTFCFTKRPA